MASSAAAGEDGSDWHSRVITVCTFIPALALLIPVGVYTQKALPALGLVPMALSTGLGAARLASNGKSNPRKPYADFIVALSLLAILIPSYVCLARCSPNATRY
jgi:hypothetical protein